MSEASHSSQGSENPMQIPQGNPPPIILLSPWDGEIDLSTKEGKSLWHKATTPMEIKFTGYAKDLNRFLAELENKAETCRWHDILEIDNKNLIRQYGEITREQVKRAKEARENAPVFTLAQAQPKIKTRIMFQYVYESLGQYPQKKLNTILRDIGQDGPLLLKTVLDQTFVATNASTFNIKEKFYELNLKK